MKIRMKFKKQGSMKFIGHLDLMRYFQKVMRRADVDIRYSEGFSPHQIMSFSSPLGVGLLSNGEYVDIEVNSTEDSRTMLARINAANAEGIEVTSYRRLPDSAGNAMSLVAAADYTVWLRDGSVPGAAAESVEDLWRHFETFCESPSIEIVKKTKKSETLMDLKPFLYEIRVSERTAHEPRPAEGEENAPAQCAVFLKLAAGSAVNIKPELLLEAFFRTKKQEYPKFAFQIQREEIYGMAPDGEKVTERRFIPLEEYGENIE